MELKGTLKRIFDTQTFASGFQKRECVILTEEQYPQPISIELLQDRVDLLDKFREGDSVVMGINIRGREWVNPQGETKYFNSITAWKVTRPAGWINPEAAAAQPTQNAQENPFASDDDDDLPF